MCQEAVNLSIPSHRHSKYHRYNMPILHLTKSTQQDAKTMDMKNPDRYHVLLDVIFLGERSLNLGDL